MKFKDIETKCAICGWEGNLVDEIKDNDLSFDEQIQQNNFKFAHNFVEQCPKCMFVAKDISKVEFKNTREIMATDLFKEIAFQVRDEEEDPYGFLERTEFSKYVSYALVCDLNNELYKAASFYWQASKLVHKAEIGYFCDENNDHQSDNYLEIVAEKIRIRAAELEKRAITLLKKLHEEDETNIENFCNLFVCLSFFCKEEAEKLLPEAEKFVSDQSISPIIIDYLKLRINSLKEL